MSNNQFQPLFRHFDILRTFYKLDTPIPNTPSTIPEILTNRQKNPTLSENQSLRTINQTHIRIIQGTPTQHAIRHAFFSPPEVRKRGWDRCWRVNSKHALPRRSGSEQAWLSITGKILCHQRPLVHIRCPMKIKTEINPPICLTEHSESEWRNMCAYRKPNWATLHSVSLLILLSEDVISFELLRKTNYLFS